MKMYYIYNNQGDYQRIDGLESKARMELELRQRDDKSWDIIESNTFPPPGMIFIGGNLRKMSKREQVAAGLYSIEPYEYVDGNDEVYPLPDDQLYAKGLITANDYISRTIRIMLKPYLAVARQGYESALFAQSQDYEDSIVRLNRPLFYKCMTRGSSLPENAERIISIFTDAMDSLTNEETLMAKRRRPILAR